MFDLEECLRQQLRSVMTTKQILVFPEAEDPRVLAACSRLLKFANVILVAPREAVEAAVDREHVALECSRRRFFTMVRFVDPSTDALTPAFAARLTELSRGRKWEVSPDEAATLLRDPVYYAILCVREGYADAVLGGLTHASRDFFLPCLRILEKQPTVYEMALFALPDDHPEGIYRHNLVMFADVALNPVPTPEALADIAVGACRTMRDIVPPDVLPEINGALLSYSTRGSGQGPSVERVRAAEPLIQAKLAALAAQHPAYASIRIITEMQISVALSEAAARTKLGPEYAHLPGAGRANVLVVPNLDTGNLLYHIYATRFPNAQATFVIGGLGNQALDFSRSSNPGEITRGAKALLLRRFKSDGFRPTPRDHFFPRYRILTVHPTLTSTHLALFEGEDLAVEEDAPLPAGTAGAAGPVMDALPAHVAAVERFAAARARPRGPLHAVVGRGGLLRPIESGTYRVDDSMVADLERAVSGEHVSNLGCLVARRFADAEGVPAYTVDPPVVDELAETSRLTGYPGSEQEAAWHALSQKWAAKLYAEQRNREYEDLNLIVAHVGAGVSVGSHVHGRCVKVKNALFDGPMTPTRAGSLPGLDLVDLCYSGVARADLIRRLVHGSGLLAYLGTADCAEIERRIGAGDHRADTVYQAMIDQLAAEIASHVPGFHGTPIDAIVLTGELLLQPLLRARLLGDLQPLAPPVTVFPGDRTHEAMRDGALRVLRGLEAAKPYVPLRDRL